MLRVLQGAVAASTRSVHSAQCRQGCAYTASHSKTHSATHHVPAGKIVRLKQKLADVTGAVGKLFGRKQEKDPAVAQLDAVKVSCTAGVALVVGFC